MDDLATTVRRRQREADVQAEAEGCMNKRYLIFSKPRKSRCWTQTINGGTEACVGFASQEMADECVREQQLKHPDWVSIVRVVELPKVYEA